MSLKRFVKKDGTCICKHEPVAIYGSRSVPSVVNLEEFVEVCNINNLLCLKYKTAFGDGYFELLARDVIEGFLDQMEDKDLADEIKERISGYLQDFLFEIQHLEVVDKPFMFNMVIPTRASSSSKHGSLTFEDLSEITDQSNFKERLLAYIYDLKDLCRDNYSGRSEWLLTLLCNSEKSIVIPSKMPSEDSHVSFCTVFIQKQDFIEAIENFAKELDLCI